MKKYFALLSGVLFLYSCTEDAVVVTPDPEPIEYTSGTANFSTYVALGNSLTAGYSDGALFADGQLASFPNQIAGRMALAGGGAFDIPLMADNLGGATLGGQQILGNRMYLDFSSGSPGPKTVLGPPATDIAQKLSGKYNNMGVPGAKSYHLVAPGYGNLAGVPLGLANPYFARFASSASTTVLADAMAKQPTFFTLMIGNNDVLGYATAGGAGVNQTGNLNPATYGGSDISDPNVVVGAIQAIVQTLTQGGAKGVIANVPNVLGAPYFTTVPHNPIPLDAATATMLNSAAAFGAYNAGIAQLASLGIISAAEKTKRTITFTAGAGNAVVILDESLTDLSGFNPALTKMRQATAADKVVLTAQSVIGTLVNNNPSLINGVSVPLEDKWVLTPQEQAEISTATQAINAGIAQVAQAYGLPVVDTYGFFNGLIANGVTLADGSKITAKYGSGGGFSLDGVHPSPRGYALISNLFINAINSNYKSNLPLVNPLDYKGLYVN